jgi:protein SCO1/2
MIAHMLQAMTCVARCIPLLIAILSACAAPPRVVGTELNAIDAPDFTLTDGVTGRSLTLSSLRGNAVALAFLYTTCPDVCPLTAARFKAAQDALGGDASRVVFVAVSVDPERDTPKAVQDFSATHGLRTNWHYLIGTRSQLAPIWAAYGIGVQAGSDVVSHNDAIYLLDRRGRERVLLHSDNLTEELVSDLRAVLRL